MKLLWVFFSVSKCDVRYPGKCLSSVVTSSGCPFHLHYPYKYSNIFLSLYSSNSQKKSKVTAKEVFSPLLIFLWKDKCCVYLYFFVLTNKTCFSVCTLNLDYFSNYTLNPNILDWEQYSILVLLYCYNVKDILRA